MSAGSALAVAERFGRLKASFLRHIDSSYVANDCDLALQIAKTGDLEMLEYFASTSALGTRVLEMQGVHGYTPCAMAVFWRHRHMLPYIVAYAPSGAAVLDIVTHYGKSLAHFAADQGDLETLRFLVAHSPCGALVLENKDYEGMTVAMEAAQQHRIKVLDYIVQHAPRRALVLSDPFYRHHCREPLLSISFVMINDVLPGTVEAFGFHIQHMPGGLDALLESSVPDSMGKSVGDYLARKMCSHTAAEIVVACGGSLLGVLCDKYSNNTLSRLTPALENLEHSLVESTRKDMSTWDTGHAQTTPLPVLVTKILAIEDGILRRRQSRTRRPEEDTTTTEE